MAQLSQKGMGWRSIEPNKPIRAGDDFLEDINDKYIVDAKLDGWRLEICKFDGEIKIHSRTNKPRELPLELINQLKKMPEGMSLDCEWINQSRIKAINTSLNVDLPLVDNLIVFDIRWLNGRYIAKMPLAERRQIKFYAKLLKTDLNGLFSANHRIFQAIHTKGGKAKSFYKKQKDFAISEGIVVKRLDGGLSANWYKVKYRE